MAARMGVREFRDNFTAIAREAIEPVIITKHDKVVGWFMPAKRAPAKTVREVFEKLDQTRRGLEARGIDVDKRLRELGLDQEAPHPEARSKSARSPTKRPKRR